MEALADYLATFPSTIVAMIGGAIFGGLGFALYKPVVRISNQYVAIIFTVICTVAGPKFLDIFPPGIREKREVHETLAELSKQELFARVIASDPNSKRLIAETLTAQRNANPGRRNDVEVFRDVGAILVQRAATKFGIDATRASLAQLMKEVAEGLGYFKNDGEQCVAYWLGKPTFDLAKLPQDFKNRMLAANTALVREGMEKAEPYNVSISQSEVGDLIVRAYRTRGIDVSDLKKLDKLESIAPADGCRVATEFAETIASMPVDETSMVIKYLLYAGRSQ